MTLLRGSVIRFLAALALFLAALQFALAAQPAKKTVKVALPGDDMAKPPVSQKKPSNKETEKEKKRSYDVPVRINFKHEAVVIPAKWQIGEPTKDLVRSEFFYQWQQGIDCNTSTLWAHVTISNDIAPCWPPDKEYFNFVKKAYINGYPGSLYRRKKEAGRESAGQEFIEGSSLMVLIFDAKKRCYTMKFLTCEKWVKRFFPDFKFIMDNFSVGD